MHYALLIQLILSLLCQTCLGWTHLTKLPQKRSVTMAPHKMGKIRPFPVSVADTSTRLFDTRHRPSDQSEAQEGARIRKPWLRKESRSEKAERSVVSFALLAMVSFLAPSVANAALSSTTLSATAASTLMHPRSTTSHPTTWQTWLLFAGLWVWQSAQASNLLSLLSHGLKQSAAWYMMQLTAHPVVTKSVTAGVIGVFGDCMAQGLEHVLHQRQHKPHDVHGGTSSASTLKYDSRRGLSILLDGLFLSGPLMHFGYEMFDRILPIASGGSGAALLHVLADSIFLDALFVASTFVVTGRMEGYSFRQIVPQLRRDYLPALKASWATSIFLMPIEFVCFRFLPLSYRVLAVNFIDVIWDGVISFMAHRGRQDKPGIVEDDSATVAVPSVALQ